MNTLKQLLVVASQVPDPLRTRIMTAALKVAIEDDIDPNGVATPLIVESQDPLAILEDNLDVIRTLFDEKDVKDTFVDAANSLPMILSSLTKQLEVLRDGIIPEEAEDEEQTEALQAFKSTIEDVYGKLTDLNSWMQRVADIATEVPENPAPKFPALPKSVKPNANLERDKLPVIEVGGDEDEEEDELEEPEEDTEGAEEDAHPLDDILKELG